MRMEPTGQELGNLGVLLDNNDNWSHRSPDLRSASTLNVVPLTIIVPSQRLTRAAGRARKPQLHRQLSVSSRAVSRRSTVRGRLLGSSVSQRFEGFGLELSVFLEQNFNFTFSLFQFLAARRGKLHALL